MKLIITANQVAYQLIKKTKAEKPTFRQKHQVLNSECSIVSDVNFLLELTQALPGESEKLPRDWQRQKLSTYQNQGKIFHFQ